MGGVSKEADGKERTNKWKGRGERAKGSSRAVNDAGERQRAAASKHKLQLQDTADHIMWSDAMISCQQNVVCASTPLAALSPR